MTDFGLTVALAIVSLMAAGILMWRAGAEKQRQSKTMDRLQLAIDRPELQSGTLALPQKEWLPPVFQGWLQRAGFTQNPRLYLLLALPAQILAIAGSLLFGLTGASIGLLLLYPVGVTLYLRWRMDSFHDKVVEQLPGFIDSVARILSIGSSLELAFRNASEECEEPLRSITAQMLLRTRAGLALEDAMNQVAESYNVKDLSFMAAVFYLGVRYGGNARAVLERIALSMRERERGQKELHAMTSETRASAWILSALPIVVGLLILVSNPTYLVGMWADKLGHKLLLSALALQLLGMWLLFRMAKLRYR